DQLDLAAAIKKAFPEIGLVRTRFNTITELVVEVKEREAAGLWCSKTVRRGCFFIDYEGLAFKEAVGEMASTTLVLFKTDEQPELKKVAFSPDKLSVYNKFIKVFETAGLKVVSVSDYDSDVYVVLSDGAEIRVRFDDDPEAVASRLATVYESLAKEPKKKPIEYLDLRFGSKVFLKRK
ncbi:MAG: hypothetical protein HYV68_01055, partial [Candidatus Taylorbacteria bacterium]|nr:hypothetical protein [Candidatus Taylorbacteria bacterium]